jgi:hypothetical protein
MRRGAAGQLRQRHGSSPGYDRHGPVWAGMPPDIDINGRHCAAHAPAHQGDAGHCPGDISART